MNPNKNKKYKIKNPTNVTKQNTKQSMYQP